MMIEIRSSSRSFISSAQDLAAHRGVEVRDRLVGDDDLRLEHQGAGDHHPLALAARELVRVEQVEPLGRTQARARERLARRAPPRSRRSVAWCDAVDPQRLGDDLVDRLPRVERAHRVLEDHLHPTPKCLAQVLRRGSPSNRISPCLGLIRPMIARAVVVLPQPGLAGEREDLPAPKLEARRRRPRARRALASHDARAEPDAPRERHAEVADLEHRRPPGPDPRRGSSTLTRPSSARRPSRPRRAGTRRGARRRPGRARAPSSSRPRTRPGTADGTSSRTGIAAGSRRIAAESRRRCGGTARRRSPGRPPASAFVYGCCGVSKTSRGGALLDDPARVHDREPVGDLDEHREVVRDEQHREAELALEALQQLEHLRLDHHVEGGGRLVGDDRGSGCTRAPSRSSRAASGRPRARAGSREAGAAAARPARAGRRPAPAPPARRPGRG